MFLSQTAGLVPRTDTLSSSVKQETQTLLVKLLTAYSWHQPRVKRIQCRSLQACALLRLRYCIPASWTAAVQWLDQRHQPYTSIVNQRVEIFPRDVLTRQQRHSSEPWQDVVTWCCEVSYVTLYLKRQRQLLSVVGDLRVGPIRQKPKLAMTCSPRMMSVTPTALCTRGPMMPKDTKQPTKLGSQPRAFRLRTSLSPVNEFTP